MTTEQQRLETVSVGTCPTCTGPAQLIDPDLVAATPEGAQFHPATRTYVRHVELPNIDEDLGDGWTLTGIDPNRVNRPKPWLAKADRYRPGGLGRDVEYGFGDSPSQAYLALRAAIEKRR